MTTLRHSPDFNLILIPNTNVFFVFRFKSSKIAKLLSRIYWLVIMIWWWHCVETWHAGHWTGGAKFLIFFYHRSEARWCWWQGHAVKLWSSQYLCHIDTSPASLICDHSHDTAQYGRGSWWISDGQLEQSFHYMMKTSYRTVKCKLFPIR